MSGRVGETKIFFEIGGSDRPNAESLRATYTGPNRYRVENVPFFAREISYKDIVECEARNGDPWFVRRIRRSGYGTMRIVCKRGFEAGAGLEVVNQLIEKGCTLEFAGNLAAVAIPPQLKDPELDAIEAFLRHRTSEDCYYEISDS